MEFQTILLIAILVILFIFINRLSELSEALRKLGKDINDLKYEWNRQVSKKVINPAETEKPIQPIVSFNANTEVTANSTDEKQIKEWVEPKFPPLPVNEEKEPLAEDLDLQKSVIPNEEDAKPYIPTQPVEPILTAPGKQETWFEKWLKDNPDIEKFIGEDIINKIGIAVLVLGIAFFVKYAIDQDWIKEIGRVCIGLICGAVLIGLAHKLRKNYHSFSSVLVGGGLAVFYFTIALAFHQYQLLSQTTAFISMVVITIFAVLLSILYDRIELAIIATLGGFITPFLVSTGQSNYMVLFSYLSILNTGLIILAWYKNWRPLNFISFVFTAIIYISWIIGNADSKIFSYKGAFLFGIIFYCLFVIMNVIHHVGRGSKLNAFDFIILLSINLCFYGTGIYLLNEWSGSDYTGLFTGSLGFINLLLGWLFFKQSKADKNFIYLIIGITVTYISLTAPVQLHGHFITMFWAAETVLLLWLYQRSFIQLLKIASALVTVLMLFSLVMDWQQVYYPMYNTVKEFQVLPVLANKGFVSGFICAAAMLIVYTLLNKEADIYYLPGLTTKRVRYFYLTVSLLLLFCSGAFEVSRQLSTRFPNAGFNFIYLQLYVSAFFAVLLHLLDRLKVAIDNSIRLLLPLLIFILYIFNASNIYITEKDLLASASSKLHFMAEWISIVFLLVLIYGTINYIRKNKSLLQKRLSLITWVITTILIILFSIEIRNLFVWFNYSNAASIEYSENLYGKAGLSIVWGLSSFLIIWLGLTKKYKPLRLIALAFFGITIIKLFAYDIQNIPPAGKIIAFILLGVLLLIVSFMYQRLKKIIIDDTHTIK